MISLKDNKIYKRNGQIIDIKSITDKLLYEWTKTDVITLREFITILTVVKRLEYDKGYKDGSDIGKKDNFNRDVIQPLIEQAKTIDYRVGYTQGYKVGKADGKKEITDML